jgi:hypothetical protein
MSANTFYGSISSLYGASYLRFSFIVLTTVLSCVFYCLCVFFYKLQALILLGLGDHIYQAFKGQILKGSVICFAWTSVDGYWKGSGKGTRKRKLAVKR